MGQAQVVAGADFSGLRLALPEANIPPYTADLEAVFIGAKHNQTTGTVTEPLNEDGSKDLLVTAFGSSPLIATNSISSQLGNKTAIYYNNASSGTRTKSVSYAMNHSGNKLSISCIYARQSDVALTVSSILWHFQAAGGNSLALETSGTNSKIAIIVNGTRTELQVTNVINTAFKIRVEYDGTAAGGTIKVYVNNVLDTTLTAQVITNFIGVFYVASNNTGTTTSRFHGRLGAIYIWRKNFTDTEGTVIHNMLTSAYI